MNNSLEAQQIPPENESRIALVEQVNKLFSMGLILPEELAMAAQLFPQNFTQHGEKLSITPQAPYPGSLQPSNPDARTPHLDIHPQVPADSTERNVLQPAQQEEISLVPGNKSIDGRNLDLVAREQRLLEAIRRGDTQEQILNTIYFRDPAESALGQMLRDAGHINEVLGLAGFTLALTPGKGGYSMEEKRKGHTASHSASSGHQKSKQPQHETKPHPGAALPDQSPEFMPPRPPRSREMIIDSLIPTEKVAYLILSAHASSRPISGGVLIKHINATRDPNARPLNQMDLFQIITSLKKAGIPVEMVTQNGIQFYNLNGS